MDANIRRMRKFDKERSKMYARSHVLAPHARDEELFHLQRILSNLNRTFSSIGEIGAEQCNIQKIYTDLT